MGQICCSSNLPNHKLIFVLHKAAARVNLSIDQLTEIPRINLMIASKSSDPLEMQNCTVIYCQETTQENNYFPQLASKQRLIIRHIDTRKAIILFEGGYYIGPLKGHSANGEQAEMYLIKPITQPFEGQRIKLVIKGKWENDLFCKGDIFNQDNVKLFNLNWNATLQIVTINFEEGQINQYRGGANFHSHTLPGILTANVASVVFRDGARYNGPIKNGNMHTGDSQGLRGQYTSADRRTKYKGEYLDGVRHGKSQMQMRQGGEVVRFKMRWEMGTPIYQTLQLLETDSLIKGSRGRHM